VQKEKPVLESYIDTSSIIRLNYMHWYKERLQKTIQVTKLFDVSVCKFLTSLSLSYIYTPFIACASSVDPDQPAHSCRLIRICAVPFLVRNNLTNSADPDQMIQGCPLIWIYIVRPCRKGVYEEQRAI
jgi:hypothetical protein